MRNGQLAVNAITTRVLAILLTVGVPSWGQSNPVDIARWQLMGNGFTAETPGALLLAEYPGSKGVMLVSPSVGSCSTSITFEVLPLNPESVIVVILSASDSGAKETLTFPPSYAGEISHLTDKLDAYFFAFQVFSC